MKNFRNLSVIFIFSSFCLLHGNTFAMNADEIKSAISQKMRDRHAIPDANFWANLGPESVPVMAELFQKSNSAIEESWLLDGFSHFNDPSIALVLEPAIQNADNAVLKKKMLGALIDSQGDPSFDFVEPYLKDKDPHIRLTVARGMQEKMSDLPGAQTRLAQFLADEKTPWVKKDFQKFAQNSSSSTQKREGNGYDEIPLIKPLPEKEWAGSWQGVWISAKNTSPAILTLSGFEKEKSWSAQVKLPKQNAFDLKRDGMAVLYYTSHHLHWIEVRCKKDDSVFIGQRTP